MRNICSLRPTIAKGVLFLIQPLTEATHLAIDLGADDQMPVIWH